ncbi:MAG: hypothetical protein H7141_07875 [Burkholderiales bacterium]|nr:hypothetical protein [Bacteroidia bacterium]
MNKFLLLPLFFFILIHPCKSQLKFIIDDFEGFSNGTSDLKDNGVFSFGNIKASIVSHLNLKRTPPDYLGNRYIILKNDIYKEFGGWGKGICVNVELDPANDYFNFYVNQPDPLSGKKIKIQLQEDDNDSNKYEKESDDNFVYTMEIVPSGKEWQLVTIPLSKFKDENSGGDESFNCTYKKGKLLCFIISFENIQKGSYGSLKKNQEIYFDFFSFSKGPLMQDAKKLVSNENFCSLGLWSTEGNSAKFAEIASGFQSLFKNDSEKNIGIVHFFQPFAVDGGTTQNNYPSVERIDKVLQQGNIPMITLENHFVNISAKNSRSVIKQPNLYNIIHGQCDDFFINWAKQIKNVKGTILLRILHEFNGDWYPWCISNNDHNADLLVQAFRHIHDIFAKEQVTNVKFIWCPNSMSVPQEKWNYIMDAYPGDEYVDFVGLDVYNGAGESTIWTSFRKVGIENYFLLTEELPLKPLLICETASRERKSNENVNVQNKSEWIEQMSSALKSDMSKIRLISWFNEREYFKINSSDQSRNAYLNYILKDGYFKSGTKDFMNLIR